MLDQGVLYRDLKPTNILFTSSGHLKLVDFGHAKKVAAPASEERSTSVCGTPHYHSPEAVRGDGHGLAAQVWALGVLLVEMLTGRPPFWEGGDLPPLREQILRAEPDWIPVPEEAKPPAELLLQADPSARLAAFTSGADAAEAASSAEVPAASGGGGGGGGTNANAYANAYAGVMAHPWLASLDWDAIERGTLTPNFDFGAHAAALLGEAAEDDEEARGGIGDDVSALSSAFADF